jgi:hypothetical protein
MGLPFDVLRNKPGYVICEKNEWRLMIPAVTIKKASMCHLLGDA